MSGTKSRISNAAIGSVLLAVALIAINCGSSPTTGSPIASATLHAEVSDAVRDAVPSLGVPTPPDMVHGTVDVSNGNATITIQFASGTMNPQTTRLTIELDTDQNASTGIMGASGVGIDYVLDLWASRTNQTLVQQAMPTTCANGGLCYTDVGTASVTLGADTMSTTVSLAMLGNASGRMNFRVFTYGSPQGTPIVVADVMPDIALPPAHVP